MSRFIPSRLSGLLSAALLAFPLAGCNLFGDGDSAAAIARPEALDPEHDTFAQRASRTYSWVEELVRSGKSDSLLSFTTGTVTRRDTVIDGVSRRSYDVSTFYTAAQPAPAGFFTRLGFMPSTAQFDSTLVPDPGPDLRYPAVPSAGWRLDTLVGGLRFVRAYTGTALVDAGFQRYDTWAFAESTWWADSPPVLVSSGTTWMGRYGLVKHVSQRHNFFVNEFVSGTLRRTLTPN